jgi:hypothetical protein
LGEVEAPIHRAKNPVDQEAKQHKTKEYQRQSTTIGGSSGLPEQLIDITILISNLISQIPLVVLVPLILYYLYSTIGLKRIFAILN